MNVIDTLDVLFIWYRVNNNNITIVYADTFIETLTTGSDSDHEWDDSIHPRPTFSANSV